MATKGTPYRVDFRAELDRIENRRIAAEVTIDELATKAHLTSRTYYRMQGDGLAFRRHVNALAMAMRTLEGDRKREGDIFPFRAGAGR